MGQEGGSPQGQGVPKAEVTPKDRGNLPRAGQTYPGAHKGNLLVVEAVHGAGDAGSAPGPLSIDAGPGKRGGPRLGSGRCAAVRGGGRRG